MLGDIKFKQEFLKSEDGCKYIKDYNSLFSSGNKGIGSYEKERKSKFGAPLGVLGGPMGRLAIKGGLKLYETN